MISFKNIKKVLLSLLFKSVHSHAQLVQIQKTVTRGGKTFVQFFWVKPDEVKASDKVHAGHHNLDENHKHFKSLPKPAEDASQESKDKVSNYSKAFEKKEDFLAEMHKLGIKWNEGSSVSEDFVHARRALARYVEAGMDLPKPPNMEIEQTSAPINLVEQRRKADSQRNQNQSQESLAEKRERIRAERQRNQPRESLAEQRERLRAERQKKQNQAPKPSESKSNDTEYKPKVKHGVQKFFTPEELADFFGDKNIKNSPVHKWLSSISSAELNSLVLYTGDWFKYVNDSLRGLVEYQSADQRNIDNIANQMQNAISKFELPSDIEVHRQVDGSMIDRFEELYDEGGLYVDPSFVSTTPIKGSFKHYGDTVHMMIKVPQSTGAGAFMAPISLAHHEQEFLLNMNTAFKITSIERDDETGQHTVVLEVLGNNDSQFNDLPKL